MVDIEHRALGPFEQHPFTRRQIAPNHLRRVGNEGHERLLVSRQILFEPFAVGDLDPHRIEKRTVLFQILHHLLVQGRHIRQFTHSVTGAGNFVGVCRADAPARRSDRLVASHPLFGLIDHLMIRQDQMGFVAEPESAFEIFKLRHLLDQIGGADHDAVADDIDRLRIQDPRRNQM